MKKFYLFAFLFFCLSEFSDASIYTVSNNNANGAGSLNQAILDGNNHPGKDSVYFNIPSSSIAGRTIVINSPGLLPSIISPITIDGTTQTAGNAFGVSNARIRLTGNNYPATGFILSADSCEIYGLFIDHFATAIKVDSGNFKIGAVNFGNVINDCSDYCIKISGVISGSVVATLVGTDTTGSSGASPEASGIYIENSKKITIGGKQPGARNLFSGNLTGINLFNAKFIDIQGNLIGTDITGMLAVPNGTGILISGTSNNISIGGDSIKELNVVSGNLLHGIDVEMYSSSIKGNYIGTDIIAAHPLGNGQKGIFLREPSHDNIIGGTNAGAGNVIAYNNQEAISLENSAVKNIAIRGNKMFCNSQILGAGGILLNGGNLDIQPPTLVIVSSDLINGSSAFGLTVDLYNADSCNKCEGSGYLGTVYPDASGIFSVSMPVAGKVTATSVDAAGNTSQFADCKDVVVNSCIISAFVVSGTPTCSLSPLSFNDLSVAASGSSVSSWHWSFGDGGMSPAINPVHTFDEAGTYIVQLIVTSSEGCSDTSQQTVIILDGVTAGFATSNDQCAGAPIHFTDQSTSEGSSFVVAWNWNLGDGDSSLINEFDHTYIGPGDYQVLLQVTNSNGCSDTAVEILHLVNFAEAQFSVDLEPCTVDPVVFTDISSSDSASTIISWHWDFGDGNTSTDQNPSHIFTSGTYTVQLTVVTNLGCSDTVTQEIQIFSGVVAGFTYSVSGQTVNFENTSTVGASYSVTWNFGDGNTSTLGNPSHTYNNLGVYEVCLIVYDYTCNGTDTICETIMVTGIDDIIQPTQMIVTPNPATDHIEISGIPEGLSIQLIRLLNPIGNELYHWNPELIASPSILLSLPFVAEGSFILEIKTNKGIVLKKCMILNH